MMQTWYVVLMLKILEFDINEGLQAKMYPGWAAWH